MKRAFMLPMFTPIDANNSSAMANAPATVFITLSYGPLEYSSEPEDHCASLPYL